MEQQILERLSEAAGLEPEALRQGLTRPKETTRGDYSFQCFALAKTWKRPPAECAAELAARLTLPEGISRVETVGPYLNFFVDRAGQSARVVAEILRKGYDVGRGNHQHETVVIDYSSPNIAKPFHVGHLRNTILGMVIDRIYRHLGYKTIAVNHLGDWGTQFGYTYAGAKLWGRPASATVTDLVALYRRATGLKEAQEKGCVPEEDRAQPEVFAVATDYFKRLEAGDPEAKEFWQWCLDVSMDYFKRIYDRLGAHFDYYQGESFYGDKLGEVERLLKESGILEESRGALGVDLGEELGFVRIFAEDGRSLYITRDIAAAEYREKTFAPSEILYVVSVAQSLHFKQLIAVLERLKHPAAAKIRHVAHGQVPGIRTRGVASAGERIALDEFLEDAHARALKAYREEVTKRPADLDEEEVAEAVGLGAVFYSYLSRTNLKDFQFDWDDALSFQGDSGPYMQYALARIYSIEAKAREAGITPEGELDAASLADGEAYEMVALLARFDEVLERAGRECEPACLAQYLLSLAKSFSASYKGLRVLGEPDLPRAKARLALFCALRSVLHIGLTLIGVPPLKRM